MSREKILGSQLPQDEEERTLRPQKMSDMVGQREVFERLLIAVDAASKRDEPLGHILFDGPPGLGKTTFATCIPRELGVHLELTSGAALKAPKDLLPYLTNLQEKTVLFIDEIHRLPSAVEEYLYTAMEDFRIDLVLGEGINARTINMTLQPFTLIGATTRAGLLSSPLRDRFQLREHLEFYSDLELTEIVSRNAGKLAVTIEPEAASIIAHRSRGTPRVANNRLRCVRDYVTSKADGHITCQLAEDALKMWGVDQRGLDKQDRKYLETLIRVFDGGPVGLEALAHTMNIATETLSDEIEPYLLRSELLVRSPRGRMATTAAWQHLQLTPQSTPQEDGQDTLFD
jgi:Holliday junction DNA helicase RuvB